MSPEEFKSIRLSLGLSQPQLARLLGYASSRFHLAAFEATGRRHREVPPMLERLMRAYAAGYRPPDWPEKGWLKSTGIRDA